MKAWWHRRSGLAKVFIILITPGTLLIVVALVMGSLRAVGVLPPAPEVHFTPYSQRPKFDVHKCWWRETEARYGSQVAMEDLSDDAQFLIIRECNVQKDEFYGLR